MHLKHQLNDLKKQRQFYSGKKKRHTVKTQLIVDKKSAVIICTNYANGKKYDFRLFKDSKIIIYPSIHALTDTGYLGCRKFIAILRCQKRKVKKIH